MAVSSPLVTSVAIAEGADVEELGGWEMHSATTGLVDLVVDTDEEALDAVRRFLSYMPSHNRVMATQRSEEHTSELQSLMRISYAVFCLKKKKQHNKYKR